MKNIIFAIISFTIPIVILELVSHQILENHFSDFEYAKFDLKVQGNTTMVESPYQVWKHPANYTSWSGKTHFNNMGFRRFSDVNVSKPTNTIRIFIMGGSTSFGSQAAPGTIFLSLSGQNEYSTDETISAHLERALTEKYPSKQFEVINAATNWSSVHQQTIHYLKKIRSLNPDLIISMDGQNDSHRINSLNKWSETAIGFEEELLSNPKHKMRFLFKHSNTFYLMAMLAFRSGDENSSLDQELIKQYSEVRSPDSLAEDLNNYRAENQVALDKAVEEYVANSRYFHRILEEDSMRHLFFTQPQTIMDSTKPFTEKENAIRGYMFGRIDVQYFRINFFEDIDRKLNQYAQSSGLKYENMFNIFSDVSADVYTDYCHFTPLGNQKVADFLMARIESIYPQILH